MAGPPPPPPPEMRRVDQFLVCPQPTCRSDTFHDWPRFKIDRDTGASLEVPPFDQHGNRWFRCARCLTLVEVHEDGTHGVVIALGE